MLRFWTNSNRHYLELVTRPVLRSIPGHAPYQGVAFNDWDVCVPAEDEIVLAMGNKPIDKLRSIGILPKRETPGRMRQRLWPAGEGQGHWMVTYDPYMWELDQQLVADIQWDVRLAQRWLLRGTLEPEVGDYRYVENFDDVVGEIERRYEETGKPVPVTEDLETVDLDPWNPEGWIFSVAFTVGVGNADVAVFPDPDEGPSKLVLEQIRWIENSPKVVLTGANFKYDNVWKRVRWKLPSPSRFKFDTLLGGGLLNENVLQSLTAQSQALTDMGGYDTEFNRRHDKSRMDLAYEKDPDGFLVYSGGDPDVCARVKSHLVKELREDEDLARFYQVILHPAARAFENIEYRGLFVDEQKLRSVGEECDVAAEEHRLAMNRQIPRRIKLKYAEEWSAKPRQLADLFFGETGWGLEPKVLTTKAPVQYIQVGEGRRKRRETPKEFIARMESEGENWLKWVSTSVKEHLKAFADHPEAGPFIKHLRERNRAEKIKSSYVNGFLPHLRSDGRFHPTYGLYRGSVFEFGKKGDDDTAGTNTGRTSAKAPHVQTIPKRGVWAKKLRACYPAPEDSDFFNVDYSQGELKIAACLADEPTMIQAYLDGEDLHLKTGSRLAGIEYQEGQALEEKDPDRYERVRYGAKAANFGKIYDQSPEGYVDYAFREWDIIMSLEESKRIDEEFFGLYNRLRRWHVTYKDYARKYGLVVSPLGRVRHLPLVYSKDRRLASKALRQAINSPVQSTLSDMCLWSIAIAELDEELWRDGLQIVGMTHDSIYGYCPKGDPGVVYSLAAIMEGLDLEGVFAWEPQLDFTVDVEIGSTMGDGKKVPRAW